MHVHVHVHVHVHGHVHVHAMHTYRRMEDMLYSPDDLGRISGQISGVTSRISGNISRLHTASLALCSTSAHVSCNACSHVTVM